MSLLSIPVVIGAMLVGPEAGALLGLVFGLTSFAQCFGADPFGATLLNINPFGTFFMCVPTRMLMGYLAGMIFKGLRKVDKTRTVCYFVGGIYRRCSEYGILYGGHAALFWTSDYIQDMSGGAGIFGFLVTMVGLQECWKR